MALIVTSETTSDMAPPCFESSKPASSISWETRNNPVAFRVPKSTPIVEPTHARITKTHAKAAARLPEALPPKKTPAQSSARSL